MSSMEQRTTHAKIIEAFGTKPDITLADISALVGVSRSRVQQILSRHGLKTLGTRAYRFRNTSKRPDTITYRYGLPLAPNVSGKLSEIYVYVDLIRRGYEVYPSLCHTASCDIVAIKDGKIIKIEVRSARRRKNGNIEFMRPRQIARFDVLALVLNTGEVEYRSTTGITI
jgi:hypothetical protein